MSSFTPSQVQHRDEVGCTGGRAVFRAQLGLVLTLVCDTSSCLHVNIIEIMFIPSHGPSKRSVCSAYLALALFSNLQPIQ